MKTSDKTILEKIHKEALSIDRIIEGYDLNSFINDEKTEKAVCMTIINIGEHIKHISPELIEENDHISWKDISGLRNVTAHGYDTLRMEDVYTYTTKDIPEFRKQIEEILEKEKTATAPKPSTL